MNKISDTLLICAENLTATTGVLVVGRRRPNGTTDIVNALQGEDALKLYELLTTKPKKEG